MDWETQLRRLYDDLERLSALPTMPEFLRRYWLIVLSHLERCEHQPQRLLRLCEAVLAYELWHHKAMTKLAQSAEAQMRYVVPLGWELRSGLLKLLRLLNGYQPVTTEERVVWELLRAFPFGLHRPFRAHRRDALLANSQHLGLLCLPLGQQLGRGLHRLWRHHQKVRRRRCCA